MFPGGIADKLGNEYERKWAVRNLLEVVEGCSTSIRYEGLPKDFHGFEFELRRPNHSDPAGDFCTSESERESHGRGRIRCRCRSTNRNKS